MGTLLRWLRPFHILINVTNAIGTLGIFAIMLLIVTDVTMRSLIGRPLVGVPEIVKLGIVSIVFLQAAHTLAVGRFTSSEAVLKLIHRRSPRTARAFRSVYMLAGAALFYFVARGAFKQVGYAYEGQDFVGSQGLFTIPIWPVHATILFGSTLLSIQFCISAVTLWADPAILKEAAEQPPISKEIT